MPSDKPPIEIVIASAMEYMVDKKIPDISEIYDQERKLLEERQKRVEAIFNQLTQAVEEIEENPPEEIIAQNSYGPEDSTF